jgi:hypothetical protein
MNHKSIIEDHGNRDLSSRGIRTHLSQEKRFRRGDLGKKEGFKGCATRMWGASLGLEAF